MESLPTASAPRIAARQIGRLIRELRSQRHLTGSQLAELAGSSQSKIAKIENGYAGAISGDQIDTLLNILKAPKIIRQQVSTLLLSCSHNPDTKFTYHFTDIAEEGNALQKTTTIFRCYLVCGISAVLQTTDFRIAYLRRLGFSPAETNVEIGKTIERQEALWDPAKTFYLVMPELALYTKPADTRVQIAQLDRIERIIGIPNVHIGIIPTQAGSSIFETSTFTLYDDQILYIFMGDRVVRLQDSEALPKYLQAFEELSSLASFDAEAIPLLRKAAGYLSGQEGL